MGVHRITDRAEAALQDIATKEGRKPSEVLSDLIVDYHRGLAFAETVSRAATEERRFVIAAISKATGGLVYYEGVGAWSPDRSRAIRYPAVVRDRRVAELQSDDRVTTISWARA